eukprot:360268-Rhodomonas_salina.2
MEPQMVKTSRESILSETNGRVCVCALSSTSSTTIVIAAWSQRQQAPSHNAVETHRPTGTRIGHQDARLRIGYARRDDEDTHCTCIVSLSERAQHAGDHGYGHAAHHDEALPPLVVGVVPRIEEAVLGHQLAVVQRAVAHGSVNDVEHERREAESGGAQRQRRTP